MLQLCHVLNGITVIEIASYIPVPLCTAILAQLGATVVKIERPGGDPMRTLPPLNEAGEHPLFAFLNRSKRLSRKKVNASKPRRAARGASDIEVRATETKEKHTKKARAASRRSRVRSGFLFLPDLPPLGFSGIWRSAAPWSWRRIRSAPCSRGACRVPAPYHS